MSGWVAVSRRPVETPEDLDEVKPPAGLTSLSKGERRQYDQAKQAAELVAQAWDGPVNVAISGSTDQEQIQVVVAPVA